MPIIRRSPFRLPFRLGRYFIRLKLLACLLVPGATSVELHRQVYVSHSADLLAGNSINFSWLVYSQNKLNPGFSLSLGRYYNNQLIHLRAESKKAIHGSDKVLYSLGGGYRALKSRYVIGGYTFLDALFKEPQRPAVNLLNLNIGLEYISPRNYQLTINAYAPLRAYSYSLAESTLQESGPKRGKIYTLTQPYYLESGNYRVEGNLRKTVLEERNISVVISGGLYGFYNRMKEILPGVLYPKQPIWILGGSGRFILQCYSLDFYYQHSFNFAGPRRCSHTLGVQWHPTWGVNTRNKKLWLHTIERHLYPLLVEERHSHVIDHKNSEALGTMFSGWHKLYTKSYSQQENQILETVNKAAARNGHAFFQLLTESARDVLKSFETTKQWEEQKKTIGAEKSKDREQSTGSAQSEEIERKDDLATLLREARIPRDISFLFHPDRTKESDSTILKELSNNHVYTRVLTTRLTEMEPELTKKHLP